MTRDDIAVALKASRTPFQMGSEVPPWLYDIDPRDASSRRGQLRFGTDVDLFEADDYYLLLPTRPLAHINGILDASNVINCLITATSKPVRVMHIEMVSYPVGQEPPQAHPYDFIIQPHTAVQRPSEPQYGRALVQRWLLRNMMLGAALGALVGASLAAAGLVTFFN